MSLFPTHIGATDTRSLPAGVVSRGGGIAPDLTENDLQFDEIKEEDTNLGSTTIASRGVPTSGSAKINTTINTVASRDGTIDLTGASIRTPRPSTKAPLKSALSSAKGAMKKNVRLVGDDGNEVTPATPQPVWKKSGKAGLVNAQGSPMTNKPNVKVAGKKRGASSLDSHEDNDDNDDDYDDDVDDEYVTEDEMSNGNSSTRKRGSRSRNGSDQPRKRRKSDDPIARLPIGNKQEELSEADKMLLAWYAAGKTWKEIGDEFHRLTGHAPKASTLPNRRARIRDKFIVFRAEDQARLIEVKLKVEAQWKTEIWERVAKGIFEAGGELHPAEDVKSEHRKIMTKGLAGVLQSTPGSGE